MKIKVPGHKECATTSLWVYKDIDQPKLPENYQLLLDSDQLELSTKTFYAAAFLDTKTLRGTCFVIIAYRGTTNNIFDYYQDYLIALGKMPTYFEKNALPFVSSVKKYLEEHYPSSYHYIVYTGHSLGAVLAELSFAKEKSVYSFVMTFDSPGTKPIIQKMVREGKLPNNAEERISNYHHNIVSDVNAINTCNAHIVQPNRTFIPYDLSIGVPKIPNMIYYFLGFTLRNQHKMLGFYKYWTEDNQKIVHKENNFDWPIGIDAAYKNYFQGSEQPPRYRYWEKYLPAWWKEYPDMHQAFDNEFSKFQDYFKKTYLTENLDCMTEIEKIIKVYGEPKNIYPVFSQKLNTQKSLSKEVLLITDNDKSDEENEDDECSICPFM